MDIRPDGFQYERHFVLPDKVVSGFGFHPVLSHLAVTRAGNFPAASGHYIKRPKGFGEYILIYCIAGEGWVRSGGRSSKMPRGTVTLLKPNISHSYGTTKKSPWTIFWLHLKGEMVKGYHNMLLKNKGNLHFYVSNRDEIVHLFESILSRWSIGDSPYNITSIAALAHQLLAALYANSIKSAPGVKRESTEKVRSIISHLSGNLSKSFTVESLAKEAGLSVPHFTTLFRELTGYSPIAYLLRLKTRHAAEKMLTTSLTVKDIAASLGMNDPYYFSRLFKKIMGVSPTEYRNRS